VCKKLRKCFKSWECVLKVWESMRVYDKVWESMRKYEKVWECMRKYERVWESMRKYEKVWESMRKYEKVWECVIMCAICWWKHFQNPGSKFFLGCVCVKFSPCTAFCCQKKNIGLRAKNTCFKAKIVSWIFSLSFTKILQLWNFRLVSIVCITLKLAVFHIFWNSKLRNCLPFAGPYLLVQRYRCQK